MRLPRLYQGRNGFLVVVAATVWMAGCQNDLPVSPVVPNPESQSLDASTRDGESFERYVLVIPDAPNQVPDAAPPPGPDAPPAPPVVCVTAS